MRSQKRPFIVKEKYLCLRLEFYDTTICTLLNSKAFTVKSSFSKTDQCFVVYKCLSLFLEDSVEVFRGKGASDIQLTFKLWNSSKNNIIIADRKRENDGEKVTNCYQVATLSESYAADEMITFVDVSLYFFQNYKLTINGVYSF